MMEGLAYDVGRDFTMVETSMEGTLIDKRLVPFAPSRHSGTLDYLKSADKRTGGLTE